MKTSILLALSVILFIAQPANADWKGRLEVIGAMPKGKGKGKDMEGKTPGKIFAKGTKIRLEMQAMGRDTIILADVKKNEASMLMPEQKLAMEMPSSMAGSQKMVSCPTHDIEGCLKAKGYKKVGNETIDGHPCVIYEGAELHGKHKTQQKIWRPTDLKEVFMIKSQSRTPNGQEIVAMVKDIQVGKLEDSLFKIPPGFQKMQMPDFGAARH